jgi:hypothetical protein
LVPLATTLALEGADLTVPAFPAFPAFPALVAVAALALVLGLLLLIFDLAIGKLLNLERAQTIEQSLGFQARTVQMELTP